MRVSKIGSIIFFIILFWIFISTAASTALYAQYTEVPQGSIVRGHLWIGDGAAGVFSSNKSAADRFRLGGEIHLGEDYQYILGWTFYDRFFSGEKSTSAGDITRRASDFNFGYFVVPDKLWLMYSLQIEDVSGSVASGTVSPIGHQASVGYRFYKNRAFNMAIEGAYLFVNSYEASTYDFSTKVTSSVKFPSASIWSLNLRFGLDIGGRE